MLFGSSEGGEGFSIQSERRQAVADRFFGFGDDFLDGFAEFLEGSELLGIFNRGEIGVDVLCGHVADGETEI